MAGIVENVLRDVAEKESKYKTTEVHKAIDIEVDEGNLITVDINPIDAKQLRCNQDGFLKNLARDNTQILINKIWELPTERVADVVVAKLPDPKIRLPREKPIPKPKATTKWGQYARLKGIQNKKRSRMVWNEEAKEYQPRWGYKRANDNTKDWLVELPDNADPNEDPFGKRRKAKKERVAKNELQRLRNIARSQNSKVPGIGLTPTETPSKDYLGKALAIAKKSTASIGRFTENLPKEKPSRFTGKKRKFESNFGDLKKETSKQLEILNNLGSDRPIIDKVKAANLELHKDQSARAKRRRENPKVEKDKGGRRSKQGRKSHAGAHGGSSHKPSHKGGFKGGSKGGSKSAGGRKSQGSVGKKRGGKS